MQHGLGEGRQTVQVIRRSRTEVSIDVCIADGEGESHKEPLDGALPG